MNYFYLKLILVYIKEKWSIYYEQKFIFVLERHQ